MDRIQNEISKIRHEELLLLKLQEAQKRQAEKETSGRYKYIRISHNLQLLCKIDSHGNLLPKELERIKNIKHTLGIK